jgi:hypothetical protein
MKTTELDTIPQERNVANAMTAIPYARVPA